jgi:hypothetical protein
MESTESVSTNATNEVSNLVIDYSQRADEESDNEKQERERQDEGAGAGAGAGAGTGVDGKSEDIVLDIPASSNLSVGTLQILSFSPKI